MFEKLLEKREGNCCREAFITNFCLSGSEITVMLAFLVCITVIHDDTSWQN